MNEDPPIVSLLGDVTVHNPDELIRRAKEALPEMAEHITRLEYAVEVLLEVAANDLFGGDAQYDTTAFAGMLDDDEDTIRLSHRPTFGKMLTINRLTHGQVTPKDWLE